MNCLFIAGKPERCFQIKTRNRWSENIHPLNYSCVSLFFQFGCNWSKLCFTTQSIADKECWALKMVSCKGWVWFYVILPTYPFGWENFLNGTDLEVPTQLKFLLCEWIWRRTQKCAWEVAWMHLYSLVKFLDFFWIDGEFHPSQKVPATSMNPDFCSRTIHFPCT